MFSFKLFNLRNKLCLKCFLKDFQSSRWLIIVWNKFFSKLDRLGPCQMIKHFFVKHLNFACHAKCCTVCHMAMHCSSKFFCLHQEKSVFELFLSACQAMFVTWANVKKCLYKEISNA